MISVDQLFAEGGTRRLGAARWGENIPLSSPGVYVVSTHEHGDVSAGLDECPLDSGAVSTLLQLRPEATVDRIPADLRRLADRLRSMWVPGSPIVYVGLAGTSVGSRLRQFYSTPIGARAPHAGGWPVKMLRTDTLWVHYGESGDLDATERIMLEAFMAAVPQDARRALVDASLPLPYANLQLSPRLRKRHGLSGVKAQRTDTRPAALQRTQMPIPSPAEPPESAATGGAVRLTQNVTASDIKRGALRVPRGSKDILPAGNARIWVQLAGVRHEASWNPRISADKERSGVIAFGRGVLRASWAGSPRRIQITDKGYRID